MSTLTKKSSKDVIGKSKSDLVRCKKHPKHQQSPGVCSLCLREKLSKISTSSTSRVYSSTVEYSSPSSLSSYYSSSEASSCASPMHRYRFTTEGKNNISLSTLLSGSKSVLRKSRSLVFVQGKEGNEHDKKKKKKGGLLSKLLRPRSKKMEAGLVLSRTITEIAVTS